MRDDRQILANYPLISHKDFKIMNKMDKCGRYNRFKNRVRGHCFKCFKEITTIQGKIFFATKL